MYIQNGMSKVKILIANDDKIIYSYKGKAILIQAWTGPKGSRRLRVPDFKTFGI
jgi:hypothetical protein